MNDLEKQLEAAMPQTAKEEDGNLLINTYQDVEPHLEYAAQCRRVDAEERGSFGKRNELRRTMSVPFNVLLAVAQRLGITQGDIFQTEHNRRIVAELKRPEFKLFRTTVDRNI